MKRKALSLHTASEQSAKVYMLPEFTIVDDNYIQSSKALKTSSTNGTNPFKAETDEPIDWFSMYNKRLFNFRSHTKLN